MGTVLDSIDNMLASAATNGLWTRSYFGLTAGTTAADANSGGVTIQRYPETITAPSVGTGLTGMYLPWIRMAPAAAATLSFMVCALEYDLGNISIATGTFTDGDAMPNKAVAGSSVQTATLLMMAAISTVLTGTAPALTITYTDQNGGTGNTASPTIPAAAAINSAFLLNPHLASGDTGVQDITACTKNGGTTGVVSFKGLLPLAMFPTSTLSSAGAPSFDILSAEFPMFKVEPGEKIAFYKFGSVLASQILACLTGVADN